MNNGMKLGAVFGFGMLLMACDTAGGENTDSAGSELAAALEKDTKEILAELESGKDVKYGCVANVAMYEELSKSSNAADKKAWEGLIEACYVKLPKKQIADLRDKLKKGELGTFDTVDLETLLEDEDFPKDGEPAKVAADAKKLLEIEIPTGAVNKAIAKAKKEKADGETVSMGCIEGQQVLDDSEKALTGDEAGKKAVAELKELCKDD